jgi:hypothetical protein
MAPMNLFLLTAVPLAAVAAHRYFHAGRAPFEDAWNWIRGAVWSAACLVVAAWFGELRLFTGDLVGTFFGLTFTDVVLVPGGVVAAWLLTTKRDPWELGLWLAIALTLASGRDAFSATRAYDLNEYFLIPFGRILVMILVPDLVMRALAATEVRARWLWIAAAAGAGLTGSIFPVLSFANLGWLVWAADLGGLAAAVWWKKTRPFGQTAGV